MTNFYYAGTGCSFECVRGNFSFDNFSFDIFPLIDNFSFEMTNFLVNFVIITKILKKFRCNNDKLLLITSVFIETFFHQKLFHYSVIYLDNSKFYGAEQ